MPIKELFVEIFGASGDPGGESLPFYSDNNAPNQGWLLSEDSTPDHPVQKTLRNGVKLVMVDPVLVPTPQELASNVPLWECADGVKFFNKNGYCKVWLFREPVSELEGHGVPIVLGQDAWCEMSHLREVSVEPPVPPVPPPAGPAILFSDWNVNEYQSPTGVKTYISANVEYPGKLTLPQVAAVVAKLRTWRVDL